MSRTADSGPGLTQRQAEIVGRQFNSAVTNTSAYGSAHPVSERAYETLHAGLGECFQILVSVTIMLDRGSFFVEDHPVDGRFNAGRLAIIFRKLELESITFYREVGVDELARLMAVMANPDDFGDVEAVRDALANHDVESIKLNQVVVRKFSHDDEIISRGGLEELTGLAEQAVSRGDTAGAAPDSREDLLARVEQVFSISALMEHPDRMAENLLTVANSDAEQQAGVIAQIRKLGLAVESGDAGDAEAISLDGVMQALARVREELSRSLAGQEETARLMAETGGVLTELDELTCRTVVSIVREEYREGDVPAGRLAQIIRRVLPESRDLKRLLPMLKQALLDDGMRLADYIEFVNRLTAELQSDELAQVLEQGAESVGFSVEELMREIRREPEEAARLIVLASELRQGGRPDEDRLSDALSEYVDRVAGAMTGDEHGGDEDNLRERVRRTRQELIRNIRAQGIPEVVVDRMETPVDAQMDRSTGAFPGSRITELLRKSQPADDSELADRLVRIVERQPNLRTLGTTLQRELGAHGYSAERIDSIYRETLARLKRKSRVEFSPGAVMNPVATGYFLKREIATCIRYKAFFSCIMLMIAQVHENEADWRTISTDEIETLMPEVFDILPPHLRDLDLLGTLGSKDRNIPLAILPMTDEAGAVAVMERMLEALDNAHLELDGNTVKVNVIGTATRFDPEQTSDSKAFVQLLKGRLATQLVSRLRSS